MHKTASADLQEGSLGATVDLQTTHPFDFAKEITIAGQAAAGWNDLSKSTDPRLSGLFAWHSANKKFGSCSGLPTASAASSKKDLRRCAWEPANFPTMAINAASTPPAGVTGPSSAWTFFAPRIPRYDSYRYTTKRLGLTVLFNSRRRPQRHQHRRPLFEKFKSNRAEQYLEAISFSRSGAGKPQTVILPEHRR